MCALRTKLLLLIINPSSYRQTAGVSAFICKRLVLMTLGTIIHCVALYVLHCAAAANGLHAHIETGKMNF